jgi:hypothetical protein
VKSDGGLIAIISSANIRTTGPDSDGISAISNDGLGVRDDVMIMNTGVISASGFGSAGIYAQG